MSETHVCPLLLRARHHLFELATHSHVRDDVEVSARRCRHPPTPPRRRGDEVSSIASRASTAPPVSVDLLARSERDFESA